jgi:hypothetical protein
MHASAPASELNLPLIGMWCRRLTYWILTEYSRDSKETIFTCSASDISAMWDISWDMRWERSTYTYITLGNAHLAGYRHKESWMARIARGHTDMPQSEALPFQASISRK